MSVKIERIYDGKVLKVNVEEVPLPDGRTMRLEVIRRVSAAAILPFFAGEQELILIRQFRPAVQQWFWEIPAGIIDPGETPEACARRELEEETGFMAEAVAPLLECYPTPGYSDEKLHIFKAVGLKPGRKRLETNEVIEERRFTLSEVQALLKKREINDPKTVVALFYALSLPLKIA